MESALEDDSVGFDFQILHQSVATSESLPKGRPFLHRRGSPLSQLEGDGYHLAATASRGNIIA